MNILCINVAVPVPSRYSFVKKVCVTLTSSDSSYCNVPCGPISVLQYLTAFTEPQSACWETPVCIPDDLPLVSCDRVEPAGLNTSIA